MTEKEPLVVIHLTRENIDTTSIISGLSAVELHEALNLVEPHGYSTTVKVWSLSGRGKRATILQMQEQIKK